MFKSSENFNNSFFGSFAYEPIIVRNQDHLLVQIKQIVSFAGLNEKLKDCYSKDGRYAYQPETMLKILIIQFLYDLSDREVMRKIDTDIICRWFADVGMSDSLPHFTKLGTFKERLSLERFEKLFNAIVIACRKAGLVSDELREIDTTDQKAKVNITKLKQLFKKDKDDHSYIDRNSPDKDASFGRKSFGKKGWYGQKPACLVEPETQIVTSLETVPANINDKDLVRPLVEKEIKNINSSIEDLGGDKGFLGPDTRAICKKYHINDYIIPRKNSVHHLEGKDSIGFYLARWKRPAVERVWSDTKRKQGLAKCRYIGLAKTKTQNLLIFIGYNLKRIAKVVNDRSQKDLSPPFVGQLSPFMAD